VTEPDIARHDPSIRPLPDARCQRALADMHIYNEYGRVAIAAWSLTLALDEKR
jgi:hypothetical protein